MKKERKPIIAYAVMFSDNNNLIEKRIACDNPGFYMTSLCIFEKREDAIKWINEKWVGGYSGAKSEIKIRKVEIIVSNYSI